MAVPTLGDILFRAASVWNRLAGNTTTTRKFLRQVGTGAASAAPAWDTLQAADLPNTAVTPGSYTATNLTVDQQGRITAAASGSSGSGTVTNTGTLTNHALIKGNGGVDVSALGSLGTTTTVLHGNAAGDPSFGPVVEADITLANNTTNNVTTAAHGFAPILPNDASKFLDGTGAYTTPAGSGATAVPIVVTANTTVTTNNGWAIPESLEIAAGVILEIEGGARVEVTGPTNPGKAIGLVLLETHVAAGSVSLNFTTCISSAYDEYQIVAQNLIPVNDNVDLRFLVSTDRGASYVSTNSYNWSRFGFDQGGSSVAGSGTQGFIRLVGGVDNSTNFGISATWYFSGPNSGIAKKIYGQAVFVDNAPSIGQELANGSYTPSTPVNAFQFLFSSGNILSGLIRVYGVGK